MRRSVLVTGVGGVVGYGVLRALREHDPELRLMGCDIYPHAVGRKWADEFLLAPPAASADWPGWLLESSASTGIDLIIPTLDPELDSFLSHPEIIESLQARVALPGEATLAAAQDKWVLHRVLEGDAAQIESSIDLDYDRLAQRLGSPFIVKPRSGYGSRGVSLVDSAEAFERLAPWLKEDFLAQQFVGTDDEEYTVGVFGNGDGGLAASITLQRWLSLQGTTMRARSGGPVAVIDEAVSRITRLLRPEGAVNFQFRIEQGEAKLLEVNARISSSASIRTAFGYSEAGMLVDYFLGGHLPKQPQIRKGETVRYFEDQVTYQ